MDFMQEMISRRKELMNPAQSIVDWFDPKNKNHLQAYKVLEETSFWPKGFIPEGLEFPTNWHPMLKTKVINYFLTEGINPSNDDDIDTKIKKLTEQLPEDEPRKNVPGPEIEEPAEEPELEEEPPAEEPEEEEIDKLYLGKSEEKHFYVVADKDEENNVQGYKVVDQEGKDVYSPERKEGEEGKDLAKFIQDALQNVDITEVDRGVVLRYILPAMEEEEAEEELPGEEEELTPETPSKEGEPKKEEFPRESKKLKEVKVTDSKKNTFQVALLENKDDKVVISINEREFAFSPDFVANWQDGKNLTKQGLQELSLDVISSLDEDDYKDLISKEKDTKEGINPSNDDDIDTKIKKLTEEPETKDLVGDEEKLAHLLLKQLQKQRDAGSDLTPEEQELLAKLEGMGEGKNQLGKRDDTGPSKKSSEALSAEEIKSLQAPKLKFDYGTVEFHKKMMEDLSETDFLKKTMVGTQLTLIDAKGTPVNFVKDEDLKWKEFTSSGTVGEGQIGMDFEVKLGQEFIYGGAHHRIIQIDPNTVVTARIDLPSGEQVRWDKEALVMVLADYLGIKLAKNKSKVKEAEDPGTYNVVFGDGHVETVDAGDRIDAVNQAKVKYTGNNVVTTAFKLGGEAAGTGNINFDVKFADGHVETLQAPSQALAVEKAKGLYSRSAVVQATPKEGEMEECSLSEEGWFYRAVSRLKQDSEFNQLVNKYGADSDEVYQYVTRQEGEGTSKSIIDDLIKYATGKKTKESTNEEKKPPVCDKCGKAHWPFEKCGVKESEMNEDIKNVIGVYVEQIDSDRWDVVLQDKYGKDDPIKQFDNVEDAKNKAKKLAGWFNVAYRGVRGEPKKTAESKMGIDYVKSVKAGVKKATTALGNKDYEEAATALEDVADDATDAARAAKKMKREDDGKKKESEEEVKEDTIPGGLADDSAPGDFDPEQLRMGIKVEMEHTDDPETAKEIAMDHLKEDPEYYAKLKKMETGAYEMKDKSKSEDWIMDDELQDIVEESIENNISIEETAKRKKRPPDPKAGVRSRGDVVFPAGSSKVKDDKDHFPINSENQARNALARANQYSSAPPWYVGSLSTLKKTVASKVHAKYPKIKITKAATESQNPEPFEDERVLQLTESLLGIKDNSSDPTKDEPIKEGDIIQILNKNTFEVIVEEGNVHSVDEKGRVEITGNTIPDKQEWYGDDFFMVVKL